MSGQRVAEVFIGPAETFVDDSDVIDFLRFLYEQWVDLLQASAAS